MARIAIILMLGVWVLGGCSGGGGGVAPSTITDNAPNVQAVTVSAGPTGNCANCLFTSVTLCYPGSDTDCQTIGDILVDTGSSGLRLVSAAADGPFNLALPQEQDSGGAALAECNQYVDLSYTWGVLRLADIKMGGEVAHSVPITVLSDPDVPQVPGSCASTGGVDESNVSALGANGIIGVSTFLLDCGDACATGATPPLAAYYACPGGVTCQPTFVTLAKQVPNPVARFTKDNNGLIVELPPVADGVPAVQGALVFGIGTESNNGLGGASIYLVDQRSGSFVSPVVYTNRAYNDSFIDSGSNGIFFSDFTGLPVCSDNVGFFCPPATRALSANTQTVANQVVGVGFRVANADLLFTGNNGANAAFGSLAGPYPGSQGFDWGLPFFFGRHVYVAFEQLTTPGGAGPYWAY